MPDTRELAIARTPYVAPNSVRWKVIEIHAVLLGARKWPDHFS